MTPPATLDIPEPVLAIARTLDAAGHEAWCVGGAIRDALLGDRQSDVDLATSATPDEVQRLFRHTVPVGVRFGTVGVLDRDRRLHEVTTFRQDVETDGRHAVVRYGASLDEDLARRDFTINAIAYHPLRHEWRDPFGGRADLEAGVVRAVGDPAARFREDYLRILRGLRFAARFGFAIEPATWAAMVAAAPGLAHLSAERVRDEWMKGLVSARSLARFTALWRDAGAARAWLPELRPAAALEAALGRADAEPRDPVLLTLLACEQAAAVLRRLRASNAEVARAEAVERAAAGPGSADEVAVRRWLASAGDAWRDVRWLAAMRDGVEPAWGPVAARIVERGDPLTRGALAVGGADLRAVGVAPGPAMGRTLDALLDRVLERPELNTRDALLALARELA